jgi:hypothetical protein
MRCGTRACLRNILPAPCLLLVCSHVCVKHTQDPEPVRLFAPRTAPGSTQPDPMGEPNASLLGQLTLLPFSASQQGAYVQKFSRSVFADQAWAGDAHRYQNALDSVSELRALCSEPLTLFMLLSILPRLTVRAGHALRRGRALTWRVHGRTVAGWQPPSRPGYTQRHQLHWPDRTVPNEPRGAVRHLHRRLDGA